DTPKRVIDVPVLTVTANRVNEMFSKPTRKLFGTRTLSGTEGESADDYMSATNSSYLIPKFDGQWYAVKDADGNLHLASDASDNSVYASFLSMDGKSMGVGELIFDADGNAKSIHLYGNTIPINLDTFQEMVTVALCNNPSSGTEEIIDMFTLQGTNATLVKDSYANLGISDVEVKISIADMYDVQHEIKPLLKLAGAGHVQTYGDKGATQEGNGIVIGTTGQSKRLEQFSVSLPEGTDGSIEYRGHLQGIGWNGWVKDGAPCGTTGESRRIEAVQMTLTGAVANDYSVWYRVHSQTFGWLGWAKDGQAAGTAGQSKRAEAVEVQALPKGQVPGDYVEGQASYIGAATADVHLQGTGWAGSGSALEFGTTGQSRRLEAIGITTPNQPEAGGVTYEVHAQGIGWMGAVADGALAGTTGQSRRLEAVRVSLTGDMANDFSVWYRVHSQTYGWLGWAHDGEEAGTTGLSKRAEAIDVQILPQGQVPGDYDGSAACVTR
ncbi:MAG: hypothetical protein Q4A01_11140, partial [Coriobacteriales bacterium]|nr:hypothetical protein [Coriobacteriales bacterium]